MGDRRDGRQVPTYAGIAWMEWEDQAESVEIRIIEALRSDAPLIGLQFLRENEKRLLLAYKSSEHLLE